MNRIKLFKKFLMPCGLCAAVPLIKSNEDTSKKVTDVSDNTNRPTQITDLGSYYRPPTRRVEEEDLQPSLLEQKIAAIRRSVQEKIKTVSDYKDSVTNTIDTGIAHSQNTLDYLRAESNVLPRFGAVGIGAISGFILGLRGGRFKRLVYSSTGAIVVASICYPHQTKEGIQLLQYYINIGYNFLKGVKPDDKEKEPSFPIIQNTSFTGITDMVSNSYIGTLYNKITKAYNDFAATPDPPGDDKSKKS